MGGGGEGSTRERAVERPVSSGDDVADLVFVVGPTLGG